MLQNDSSLQCNPTGFIFFNKGNECRYNWKDVVEIIAYKQDLMTTDEVCLDIILPGFIFTLTESHTEWEIFIKTMQERLPSLDGDWWSKVVFPPFTTNTMTIYKSDKVN